MVKCLIFIISLSVILILSHKARKYVDNNILNIQQLPDYKNNMEEETTPVFLMESDDDDNIIKNNIQN